MRFAASISALILSRSTIRFTCGARSAWLYAMPPLRGDARGRHERQRAERTRRPTREARVRGGPDTAQDRGSSQHQACPSKSAVAAARRSEARNSTPRSAPARTARTTSRKGPTGGETIDIIDAERPRVDSDAQREQPRAGGRAGEEEEKADDSRHGSRPERPPRITAKGHPEELRTRRAAQACRGPSPKGAAEEAAARAAAASAGAREEPVRGARRPPSRSRDRRRRSASNEARRSPHRSRVMLSPTDHARKTSTASGMS